MGWRHLFYEQGILHVLLLVKHLRTPGQFRSLLLVNLQWYQVISGVSYSPLQVPEAKLPYLEHAWLDSTRQFLKHCSAQLEIPEIVLPQPKRVNDTCIMEALLRLNLAPTTLRQLNFCRLWLQVTLVSDISNLQGSQIERTAWTGLKPMPSSLADWPIQQRPSETIWQVWRKVLHDSICTKAGKNATILRPGTLHTPLGAWFPDSNSTQLPRWDTFLQHNTQRLFTPIQNEFATYYQYQMHTRLGFHLASYDTNGPKRWV
jgi:hypothetical protein